MATYHPHTYVTVGGRNSETPGNEDEIWQCGVRMLDPVTAPAPIDPSTFAAAAAAMAPDLKVWFASSNAHHPNSVFLDWVKIANISASGDYSDAPYVLDGLNTAGGVPDTAPSFLTCCYSWETGKSFGRARRGRVYPPNWGTPRAGGAAITAAAAAQLVAAGIAFLDAISKSGDGYELKPYVVSSSGAFNPINGVAVGTIWDVQRRRKNAVRPTYFTDPWPA